MVPQLLLLGTKLAPALEVVKEEEASYNAEGCPGV